MADQDWLLVTAGSADELVSADVDALDAAVEDVGAAVVEAGTDAC